MTAPGAAEGKGEGVGGPDGAIELLDLSDTHYRPKGMATPLRRGGKFVLLVRDDDGSGYLVLSPAEQSFYHAHVVERFCALPRFSVPGRWASPRREKYLLDGTGWTVEGGGSWELDEEARTLRLGGRSMAYGAVDLVPVVARVAALPSLAGWTVEAS